MIAIQLIFFGFLLGVADKMPQRRNLEETDLRDGLYVGLAQVLALAPGTSRSGITITAARFSFLLLIPAVAGATAYKALEAGKEGLPPGVGGPIVVGTIAAAVSGYWAISFLLRLLRTTSYRPFVLYRYFAGAAILLIIATGLRPATF